MQNCPLGRSVNSDPHKSIYMQSIKCSLFLCTCPRPLTTPHTLLLGSRVIPYIYLIILTELLIFASSLFLQTRLEYRNTDLKKRWM